MVAVILFGRPGAGKSWLSEALLKLYPFIALVRTSSLLKEYIQTAGDKGKTIQEMMDQGEIISDELVSKLLESRLEELRISGEHSHVLIDGFPRTVPQVDSLQRMPNLKAEIFHINLPPELCLRRIRKSPNRNVRVEDKKPRIIKHRLDLFETITMPVLAHWTESHGKFIHQIDGRLEVKQKIGLLASRLRFPKVQQTILRPRRESEIWTLPHERPERIHA